MSFLYNLILIVMMENICHLMLIELSVIFTHFTGNVMVVFVNTELDLVATLLFFDWWLGMWFLVMSSVYWKYECAIFKGLLLCKLLSFLPMCSFYILFAVHVAKFPSYCKDENWKLNYYFTFLSYSYSWEDRRFSVDLTLLFSFL